MNENSTTTPNASTHSPEQPAGSGFYDWLRDLGVTRQPGWLGGVASGLAARLTIDPVIVRGIIVVIGVLGGPALLLYAAAWLLLPDTSGRIHLEEVMRGVFDRAIAGIAVMLLLAFLPVTGTGWWWFLSDGQWWSGRSFGAIVWTVVLVGLAVWGIVWLANRSSGASSATGAPASPPPAAHDPAPGEPVAPAAPPVGADDSELSTWREGQAAWRREHDTWRTQQASDAQAQRQHRLAEDRRHREAEAAERAYAHIESEKRTRPGAAYSLVAVGFATLAAGATWLALIDTEMSNSSRTVAGLSAALVVLALAIIVNGIRGRRSGGSGGVAVLVVISLVLTGFGGWLRGPIISNSEIEWAPTSSELNVSRIVVSGDVALDLAGYFDSGSMSRGTVSLVVVSGDVEVVMPADASGRVDIDITSGSIRVDGELEDSGAFANAIIDYDARRGVSDRQRLTVDVYVVSGDVAVSQAAR